MDAPIARASGNDVGSLPIALLAATPRIPTGTVKSRLHRALGDMRAAVETEPPSPSPIPGGQVA